MMKKMIKKVLALALCLVMVVGILPTQALMAQAEDPGYLELNDGYLSVKVSKENGGFLVDTLEGDKLNKSDDNKFLLYPDAAYDTSYTSFRVNRGGVVKDYIFGRDYSFLGLGEDTLTVTRPSEDLICATWSVDGLEFTQNLALMEPENQQHGMVYITYSVKNTSGEAVDRVQARVMMDTALGYQDYAVYMGAQADGSYTTIRTERTLQGNDYTNYFFAYDDEYAPSVTAYVLNATVGGTAIVPEKVTFAHWNNLASSVYDYEPEADYTQSLNFTSAYNETYMTADSAVAMYYDMGAAPAGAESEQSVALYYGVYSNANAAEGNVALNFASPGDMILTEDKKSYRDLNGDADGNFTLTAKVQNTSAETISSMAVAFYTPEGIVSYDASGNQNTTTSAADPFYVLLSDLNPGETRDITLNFMAAPTEVSDYRKINVRVFDLSSQTETGQIQLLEEKVLGSRESYILCPGVDGGVLSFVSITPNTLYTSGTRNLYLAGKNFGLLRDTSQYRVVLRPADGSADVVVPSSHVLIDAANNTANVNLEQTLTPGTWQVIIDWNDTGKMDTTGEALRFVVSESPSYRNNSYGIAAIWVSGEGTDAQPWHYNLDFYADEAAYERALGGVAPDQLLLVFRGSFDVQRDENGNVTSAEAVSLKDGEAISINECLDVSDGSVTIHVKRDEQGKQTSIDTDIDGLVTTTGANTKVWNGVCALTSLKEGELVKLSVYKYDGTLSNYAEDQTGNSGMLMLLWPGAASTAQTLAGMVMELRYAQFGVMATEPNGEPHKRVVSFAAELSPDFLVPAANIPDKMETDPIDVVQLKLAKSNYTPDQLRQVQETYRKDLERWKEVKTGSLDLRVTDILFGNGFIGFNTSLSVGIPSYADGLPSIEGTLNLKVINDDWSFGLKGAADMVVFSMEAELALSSYNGIPVPDTVRFHVGGTYPGIPVDPMGIFWIRGAGAGIDNMYETFFVASKIPPLTLLLSGEFAIFTVLGARADVGLSGRGISAALSDINVSGIRVMDYLGGSVYWYPRLDVNLGMSLTILDIINGSGTIVLQEIPDEGLFWEAFATASISIPDYVLLIGGKELGRVSLGLDAERIFGVIEILKTKAGVTYYWGGDVEFAAGKYDVPEPVLARSRRAVPVYTDPDSGKTLYMSAMTNARALASSDQSVPITETQIQTSVDGHSHSFILDGSADEDALLYVTFPAETRAMAETLKKRFSIRCDGENYSLVWLDDSKAADDPANANANAIFQYDETAKEVQITVSVTESRYFDQEITVSTPAISQLTLYGLTRLADLEKMQVSGTTATITGSKLHEISKLAVYAVDETDNAWTLAEVDTDTVSGNTVKAALRFPGNMPSGSYTLKAVGVVPDETDTPVANPMVETPFNYTNPNQPKTPTAVASLGGDYSLDVTASASGSFDGYSLTVYEQTAQGLENTVFQQQTFPADGKVMTVGGQYTVPVADAMDEDGNVLTYKTETIGLEAGRQYAVGVSTYKELSDGTILLSEEILTDALTMVKAEKPNLKLSIAGGKPLPAGYGDITLDYAASGDVTVNVSGVDTVKNGSYQLGSEEPITWTGSNIQLKDLPDGVYTLTVNGENAAGDSFGTKYQFGVDTAAPRMMLSSPHGGGFFTGDALTVTGLSEAGALITASVGETSVSAAAAEDGTFSLDVPMDGGMAYQKVVLTAADPLGNQSDPVSFTVTNSLVGDPDAVAVLLVNGKEARAVSANAGEVQLELALKIRDQLVKLNSDSMTAGLVDFQTVLYRGEANVTADGILRTSKDVRGIVRGTLETYDAVILLQNTDLSDAQVELTLPQDGYTYDETPKEPSVTSVVLHGSTLAEGKDYTVSYANNVAAGAGTVVIQAVNGSGYVGINTVSFTIEKAVIDTLEPTVAAPATDGIPQQVLNIPGLETARVLWEANDEPVSDKFQPGTAYTAFVTITPDANHRFADTVAVEGWEVTANDDGTLTLVKTFPETEKKDPPVVPVKTWLVTFVANNRVVATRTVNDGEALTDIPQIPEKIGHTQTVPVWSVTDFTNIRQDMTVHAIYTPDVYYVTFTVDGQVIEKAKLGYLDSLDAAHFPAIPAKKGYTDTAPIWDSGSIIKLTQNCTVTAVYTPNSYTVAVPENAESYGVKLEKTALTAEENLHFTVAAKKGYSLKDAVISIGGVKVDSQYITRKDDIITVTVPGSVLDDHCGTAGRQLSITVTGVTKKDPSSGDTNQIPGSGDTVNPVFWFVIMVLSMAALLFLLKGYGKKGKYTK